MKGTELVAFAILAVLIILWMTWPSVHRDARPARPRRPEGPPHPYRRAAVKPKTPRAEPGPEAEQLAWAPPEEDLIPSRLVELATRTGRVWEAIAFLEAELAARPDPDLAYLLARTFAEHGDPSAAERFLLTAARLGQRDVERACTDDAFALLRGRPAWPSIEAALRGD